MEDINNPFIWIPEDPKTLIKKETKEEYAYYITKTPGSDKKLFMHLELFSNSTFPKIPKEVYHLYIYGDLPEDNIEKIPESVKFLRIRYLGEKKIQFVEKVHGKLRGLCLESDSKEQLQNYPLKKFPSLAHIKTLKFLEISNVINPDYKIPIKKGDLPQNLEILELFECNFPSIDGNQFPETLRKLSIVSSKTRAIAGLDTLNNLEFLKISSCDIKEIPRLPVEKLKYLYLPFNKITKIPSHIKNTARKLLVLELLENQVSGALDLGIFTNLKILELTGNKIDQVIVKNCKENSELVYIGLTSNNIKSLPCLDGFKKLKALVACLNPLKNFPEKLPKSLTHLNLHTTSIQSIPDVSYLKNLESLYIFGNNIKNFDEKNFENPRLKNKSLVIKVV